MKIMSNIITSAFGDAFLTVILFAFLLVAFFGAIWYFAQNLSKSKENCLYVKTLPSKKVIWIIIGVGLIVRLILGMCIKGYRGALGTINYEIDGYYEIYKSVEIILNNGYGYLYSYSMDVHPLAGYILSIFVSISKLFGVLNLNSYMVQFFLKLPLILCDGASAYRIYRLAKKYTNEHVGLVGAGTFMLCPVFMFGSAISVSVYPMLILGLIVTFYLLVDKNFIGMVIAYSLTLLVAPQAVYLFPIVVCFVVYNYVKVLKKFLESHADEDKKTLISLPCIVVACFALIYLLSLPYFMNDFGTNPIKIFKMLFFEPFTNAVYFAFNSLSVYVLFGKNGARLNAQFPSEIFVIAFFIIIIAVVLIIYLSRRNRAALTLLAAYIVVTQSIYMIGSDELSMLSALALLIVAFILIKDKRILNVFGLLSLFIFINYMTVMTQAGFLSNASSISFMSTAYKGSSVLLSSTTFGKSISIITSVGTILTHLYFTLLILDLTVSNVHKPLNSGTNFKDVMKEWISIKK